MDVYVVMFSAAKIGVVGVSARLQGAEAIRADFLKVNPDAGTWIENHELRDMDDR